MGRKLYGVWHRTKVPKVSELFLFDIEGTTTDIKFVHKVLFPYSTEKMSEFIRKNKDAPEVASAIKEAADTVLSEENKTIDIEEVIAYFHRWIKEDRKIGALKKVQGLIWDQGYQSGDFLGHVYSDVKPYFEKLKSEGKKIAIYSSGSVHAQKLIMKFSVAGDLTPYISYYFDTQVGGKREPISYLNIAKEINLAPEKIHFYSDIKEELAAARAAGMEVTQLLREGTIPANEHPGINEFN